MDIGKVQGYSMPFTGAEVREKKAPESASNADTIRDVLDSPGYTETPSGIKHWAPGSNPAAGKDEIWQTPAQKAGVPQVVLIVPKYFGIVKKTGGVDPFGNRFQGEIVKEDGRKKIELKDPRTGNIAKLDIKDSTLEVATAPIIAQSKPYPSTFQTITTHQRIETLKPDGEINFRTNEKTVEDVEYYVPPNIPMRDGFPVVFTNVEKSYEETVIPKGGAPVTSTVEEKDGKKTVTGTLPSRIEGDTLVIDRPDGSKDAYEMFIPPAHLPGRKKGA